MIERIALALALGVAGCSPAAPGAAPSTIQVVDFAGVEAALEARRGTPMLLNFWAMWCQPCVVELPELVAVSREFADDAQVLGVSYDLMVAGADTETIESTIAAFLGGRGLEFDTLVYDEADYDAINARFDLPGEIPVTLAIDANGTIVDRQHGKAGHARFEEMMRKALD